MNANVTKRVSSRKKWQFEQGNDKLGPSCTVSKALAQSRAQTSSQHFPFSVVIGVRHQIILDWTFLADPREVAFFSYPVWSPDRELALLGKRAK